MRTRWAWNFNRLPTAGGRVSGAPATQRIGLPVLQVALLVWLAPQSAVAQFQFDEYRLWSITCAVADWPQELIAARAATIPTPQKYRVRVTVTGERRVLLSDSREFIKEWNQALPDGSGISALLHHEILIREGNESFWVPIQEQLLAPMEREVRPGDIADLYIIHAGSTGNRHIFFVNEFQALGLVEQAQASSFNEVCVLEGRVSQLRGEGRWEEAIQAAQRLLTIREHIQGPEHQNTGATVNDLAQLHQSLSDYTSAEPLYRRALSISEKTLGQEDPGTATTLINLAALYSSVGDYPKAEPISRRALTIFEKSLGSEDITTAGGMNNLAGIYESMGRYSAAEALYRRALAIFERELGPSEETALALNNLATLYSSMRQHRRAEALHRRALAMLEKTLGPDHPHVIPILTNLARSYISINNYAKAEPLTRRAVALCETALGAEHPWTASSLDTLAAIHVSKREYAKAEPLYRRALLIARRNVDLAAATQAERQQLAMSQAHRAYLDKWLAITKLTDVAAETVFEELLEWKGAVVARQWAARVLRNDLRSSGNAEALQVYSNLENVTRRLASVAGSAIDVRNLGVDRQNELSDLTAVKERLEQELATLSANYRRQRSEIRRTVSDIRNALPQHAVLLDFVQYGFSSAARPANESRLAVLVVGSTQPVVRVELGSANRVTQAVEVWRETFGTGERGRDATRVIRSLVWEPLTPHLGNASLLLISPDGALNRFPFGALRVGQPERYLVEDSAVVTIPAPRLLPDLTILKGAANPALLSVGDIDFDASPIAFRVSGLEGLSFGEQAQVKRSSPRTTDVRWRALPATGPEAETVAKLFEARFKDGPALRLVGLEANEAALRTHAPRVSYIHLATHGYFTPPQIRSALLGDASRWTVREIERQGVFGWNPGLLSGIVLAGANRQLEPNADDGILTALEVSALDLTQVELVVLSACETGLGATAGGEGLLGLQRAFATSGARSVVASLWKVPDGATRRLMESFYENLWNKGLSPSEALRHAQLWMLRQSPMSLAWNPPQSVTAPTGGPLAASNDLSPFYWAAFVLSGGWE